VPVPVPVPPPAAAAEASAAVLPARRADGALAAASAAETDPLLPRLRHTLTLASAPGGDRFALVALAVSAVEPEVGLHGLAEAVARRVAPLLKPGERLVGWRDATPSSSGPVSSVPVPSLALQALVLLEELDADAHARLPARLRTWRAELCEPYTVADHPVPVRVALGVVDQPPARTDRAGGGAAAGAPDPAAQACASALSLAGAALAALAEPEAPAPRGLDPRSCDGLWFHAPAFDHWRDEQAAAERQWAERLAPGALQVRLGAVAALADGTPAGWLAEARWSAPAGVDREQSGRTAEDAAALVVDDDVAAAGACTVDWSTVPSAWRRTLARTAWAQALRALEARDPGARDTWVAVPVPEGLWLDDDLQACVAQACESAGQPAARLDLLLDERVVAARPDDIARQLQAVRATGARVTLVGLTRGAGSLSWLARLPLTAVRVDAALVHDLPLRETAHVLVRALVQLAAEHRQLVWAEAATTPSQRRALRDAGVVWAHAGASSPSDEGREDGAERAVSAPAVALARRSTATLA